MVYPARGGHHTQVDQETKGSGKLSGIRLRAQQRAHASARQFSAVFACRGPACYPGKDRR